MIPSTRTTINVSRGQTRGLHVRRQEGIQMYMCRGLTRKYCNDVASSSSQEFRFSSACIGVNRRQIQSSPVNPFDRQFFFN